MRDRHHNPMEPHATLAVLGHQRHADAKRRKLDYLPRHRLVIGGGYSGLELAQAYRRFGSDVTIMDIFRGAAAYSQVLTSQELRAGFATRVLKFLLRPSYPR
jgi:pyruvate/2-oxoglutarate dehydrogenase complex dihydrolipoamide dehydrogenase (E3) component